MEQLREQANLSDLGYRNIWFDREGYMPHSASHEGHSTRAIQGMVISRGGNVNCL